MIKIYKWHPILALVVVLSSIISPEVFDRNKFTSALAHTTEKGSNTQNVALMWAILFVIILSIIGLTQLRKKKAPMQ